MTREEFYDEYNSWSALMSLCCDHDLDSCENVYTAEQVIDDCIGLMRYESSYGAMCRVYDILDSIDFDDEFFIYEDGDYRSPSDNDFDEYAERVADEYDECVGFEDYQEDDEDDEYYEPTYDVELDPWHYDDSVVDESVDITVFSEIITCQ